MMNPSPVNAAAAAAEPEVLQWRDQHGPVKSTGQETDRHQPYLLAGDRHHRCCGPASCCSGSCGKGHDTKHASSRFKGACNQPWLLLLLLPCQFVVLA
jgi:hypothetical protein